MRGQHQAVAVPNRQVDRLGDPLAHPFADHHAVDHRFDVVRLLGDQLGRIAHVDHLAVDPGAEEPGLADRLEHVLVLALSPANQRREDHHPRAGAEFHQGVEDLLGRLLADRLAALVASRLAQPGEQQPQVVVDFGDRGHGAARIVAARPLVDRDRRLKALDQIDVGPFELMQELPGVGREAFDVLPLALGIEGVEGQRAFARAARAGDDHEPVARQIEVDVPQVVHPRPADTDAVVGGSRFSEAILCTCDSVGRNGALSNYPG